MQQASKSELAPTLVLAVGPIARRALLALAEVSVGTPNPVALRGLTAEYPAVVTRPSDTFSLHDLADLPHVRDAFSWCRDHSLTPWRDPIPGQDLAPVHVLGLYNYATGQLGQRVWDDLLIDDLSTIHVLCNLHDGTSCLLPELLQTLAERRTNDSKSGVWTHIHAVLPRARPGFSTLDQVLADDAGAVLQKLTDPEVMNTKNVAIWILGEVNQDPLSSMAEACSLVTRLLHDDCADSLTAPRLKENGAQPIFGSYRCAGGASMPPQELIWPSGFPETRVLADRRDGLGRNAIVWNGSPSWLTQLVDRDPRWEITSRQSCLPGWMTCRMWTGIDQQDLWWWHRDGLRIPADSSVLLGARQHGQ